ncbi:MAG: sigma-70 family RNA polymerase sigma factor [Planctomycetota bacterium]
MTAVADARLARRASCGDPAAVPELLRRLACVEVVLRQHNRRAGHPLSGDDLADAQQETLTAVWRKLDRFEGRSSLETWVFGFCHHEFQKALHRSRRWPAGVNGVDPAAPSEPMDAAGERVRGGLERLGAPAADLIRMRHFDERSFADMAARTGLALGTVKSRYYRGLGQLRVLLQHRSESS